MRVHLVNPSHVSFGVGVITPRWLYVLAAATPDAFGDPIIVDETLEPFDPTTVRARRRRRHRHSHRQRAARLRSRPRWRASAGATVVFGGIHATLYPEEPHELGGAHAVVKGDGDVVWAAVLDGLRRRHACSASTTAGGSTANRFMPARWDLLPDGRYMWASVQTVRGCPKHCSFCSVWRTDGQKPRQRRRRRRSSTRSSSCGATASASSRSPTTTSIR